MGTKTPRYLDRRARRLATNGHAAVTVAAALGLFSAAAVLGASGTLSAVHYYLTSAVLGMVLVAIACLYAAGIVENRRRLKTAADQAETLAYRQPGTLPRRMVAGATATEVAALAPRVEATPSANLAERPDNVADADPVPVPVEELANQK